MTAILDETLPSEVTLFDLAVDPPPLWERQRRLLQAVVARQLPDDIDQTSLCDLRIG